MSIWDLFSSDSGTNAAAAAKKAANQAAKQGFNAQSGFLKKGKQEALGYQQQALPQWQTMFGQGTSMAPTYFGALGLPGYDSGAAKDAFMSSIPGQMYQAQQPDIYEAALRRGGLTGQTGQIPIDLTNETMKSLNQFYPGWQSALNPYNYETAGATGMGNVFNNQSDIATGTANQLSTAAGNKFNAMGQANAAYPQNVYAAQQGAASNQLSALFGLGGLALGAGNLYNNWGTGGSTGGSYDPNWPATVNYG